MTTDRSRASRAAILRGLLVAGALLAATMGLQRLAPAHLTVDAARRLTGMLLGAVVILYANAVPKALPSLLRMRCDPAVEQALRRFTGRTLVLGGVGFVAAWALAPLTHANLVAAALLGTALLLVVLRLTGVTPRPRR